MAIKPVGHRVLVKPKAVEETTTSGIVVVSNIQEKRLEEAGQVYGVLTGVGPQAWKAFGKDHTGEPWAEVGDTVLFSKFAGFSVEDPETEEMYKVLNDEDIVAIITKGNK